MVSKKRVSQKIREQLDEKGIRYWAGDNISEVVTDKDKSELIDELTEKFEGVLDSLVIDRENDPNSMDTPRRLAKMYINEIMGGRYEAAPKVTAFPNVDPDTRYGGIIVTRAELISMCSHHHQPVKGVAYIGLLAGVKVIGLSKYTRIAQWCANRGTLQEELTMSIANELQKHTGTKDLAVYVQATHGCMEHRGVMAHSSLTQTTVVHGLFHNDAVKSEFMNNIKNQMRHC